MVMVVAVAVGVVVASCCFGGLFLVEHSLCCSFLTFSPCMSLLSFLSRRIRRCGEIRGIAVHVEQFGQPSVESGMRSFKTSGVDHRRHARALVRFAFLDTC